ncbi:DNA utilization protein GntX [Anatilimnocola aggregata]|uniref:DNA utilization protein GntX n=1 Tax=Anatilimnocola aggregata TaxID=2528021 RepID=A0A517YB61_9BACT|nr:double zinc ribbon domain-containing protein [Anatilimnocola aggregata]QDU27496.1 DNA utilization protein GntX [Anatilimnocola aggregata]
MNRPTAKCFAWLTTGFSRSLGAASDLLFPPACTVCGDLFEQPGELPERARLLCLGCEHQLWARERNYCPRCAMPYPDLPNPNGDCVDCRKHRPAFDAARTLGVYDGVLRDAVLRMKNPAYETLARQIGDLLAERIQQAEFTPAADVVAPVSMHWLKRVWRGTNPAESLAGSISSAMNKPLVNDLVRCKKWLAKQHHLPASERQNNVRGAYTVGWGFDIRGANVLLVDDVITTGATSHAIAKELKKAGAARVYVAAVARATGFV